LEAHLVLKHIGRWLLGAIFLGLALSYSLGQEKPQPAKKGDAKKEELKKAEDEYRTFFKKPENAMEFWAAMNFEIGVGKFDLALEYLKGFMGKDPKTRSPAVTDQELVDIESAEGMSAFLRLLQIPELREEAKPLLERVNAAVKKHLGDPARIAKYIKNLSASPEERAYAIIELRRSGPQAVPQLVESLLATQGATEHAKILSVFAELGKNIVPPLLAALDVDDPGLRLELLQILRQRVDKNAVPYLWFLSASPQQPELIRKTATDMLSLFLSIPKGDLPSSKIALTREAERYYQHQVTFSPPNQTVVWYFDKEKKQILSRTLSASEAEEFYGLRFSGQALELDPSYVPAQVVYVSLALEKGFERAGLDQPLEKGAPAVKEVLKVVNPDLIETVLDRALADGRVSVAVGAARALGDIQDRGAARSKDQRPPALVRALNFPDRRVQFAAADALLKIPGLPNPLAITRTVEVLRRTLSTDAVSQALIGDGDVIRAGQVGHAVKQAGYEPIVVHTGREALRQLRESAGVDVLLIDFQLPDPGLPYLLAQLRSDINSARLPVLVTVPPNRLTRELREQLRPVIEPYRNVWVVATTSTADILKSEITERVAGTVGRPLTEAERKADATLAMLWLKRMAVGEVKGYDVEPARDVILKTLSSNDLGSLAIEAAGRLPGAAPQTKLADIVLDNNRPAGLRSQAAEELVRHIQAHGLALSMNYVRSLQDLFDKAPDAKLKANVAVVLGALRPDARLTGGRLLRYGPPPLPPVKASEAKGKSEETKEKEEKEK
jgi:CheY-like chemotaxis protein